MKTCTKCRVAKPRDRFHRHSRRPDGLQCWCIECFDEKRGTKRRLAKHPEGMRHCYGCGQTKPLAEFYGDDAAKGGGYSRCKPCALRRIAEYKGNNPGRVKEWNRRAAVKRAPSMIHDRRRLKYGLSPEQYESMVAVQNGRCLICNNPPRGKHPVLVVDHDHATGAVRGLLCSFCNSGLGYFEDDPQRLVAASEYLKPSA